MTRLEALTLNLVDDVLTESEESELRDLLSAGDQARQSHLRILQIEAGLRAQRKPAELPQLVMARLRGERTHSIVHGVMTQIRSQTRPEWARGKLTGRNVRTWPFAFGNAGWWPLPRPALALAACVAIFAGMGIWLFGPAMGKPLLVEVAGSKVVIERQGRLVSAAVGEGLHDEDVLRTAEDTTAVIGFGSEQTRIKLLPGTALRLTALSGGKHFALDWGKLEASVARQRPFRPMILITPQAEAQVIGTRFTLTVNANATRLDVTAGLVRFTRTKDEQFVRVGADQFAVAANNYELAALPATGRILREYWTNVPGEFYVTYLLSNSNYPDHPSGRDYLSKLETSSNSGTNYGARIRGYLLPPTTGDYTFWITAGDGGDLYLSPDDNPDHRQIIAHWEGPKSNTRKSAPLPLKAGFKYYLEVLQKAGNADSHLAVEWQGPGRGREVIPGEFVSPWKTK